MQVTYRLKIEKPITTAKLMNINFMEESDNEYNYTEEEKKLVRIFKTLVAEKVIFDE